MSVQPGASVRTREAQALLALSAAYRAEQDAERRRMIAAVLAVWRTLDMKHVIPSWSIGGIGARIYLLVSGLMELFAADANGFVRTALLEQEVEYTGPDIDPLRFAGIASDGRDLESLLAGAIVKVREAQRKGLSDEQAALHGRNFLELVANTQVSDAARAAESASITVADGKSTTTGKKVVIGWVRMLTPPSCSRCAVLAGKFYRWNSGFERHPNCLPAGTLVSGPRMEAATRRWFEGELVTIRTASGQLLSLTGNHPVLTDGGWLPARLLKEGDHVIRSLGVRSTLGHVPDDHQVPARVEDVFRALNVTSGISHMPVAAEDFHGDGFGGEVDVVAAHGLLGGGVDPSGGQAVEESFLSLGSESADRFPIQRGAEQRLVTVGGSTSGIVGGSGLSQALLGSHLGGSHETGIRMAADLRTLLNQARSQGGPADLILLAERVLALASRVLRRDFGNRQDQVAPRWDAPAAPFAVETRAGYASQGKDLLERLTGQVALDRVVEKVSRQWSGHVYNLTSVEGWFDAESIVVSNCDCRHIPTTLAGSNEILTNPYVYFNSLTEEEQNYYFGKAQAQAIRDGADINQVVNASRTANSMFTADEGRRYTREGTTRRGYARGVAGRVLRPTVWQLYKDADGNQEVAKALLLKFGYALPQK